MMYHRTVRVKYAKSSMWLLLYYVQLQCMRNLCIANLQLFAWCHVLPSRPCWCFSLASFVDMLPRMDARKALEVAERHLEVCEVALRNAINAFEDASHRRLEAVIAVELGAAEVMTYEEE